MRALVRNLVELRRPSWVTGKNQDASSDVSTTLAPACVVRSLPRHERKEGELLAAGSARLLRYKDFQVHQRLGLKNLR